MSLWQFLGLPTNTNLHLGLLESWTKIPRGVGGRGDEGDVTPQLSQENSIRQ